MRSAMEDSESPLRTVIGIGEPQRWSALGLSVGASAVLPPVLSPRSSGDLRSALLLRSCLLRLRGLRSGTAGRSGLLLRRRLLRSGPRGALLIPRLIELHFDPAGDLEVRDEPVAVILDLAGKADAALLHPRDGPRDVVAIERDVVAARVRRVVHRVHAEIAFRE